MTTRAIVPNADGEGSLGGEGLNWGAMYVSSPEKNDNSQKVPSTAWVRAVMEEAYSGLSGTVLPTSAHVGQSFTLDRGDVSDGYERFVKYVCTGVVNGVPTWTTEFLLDPAHAVSTVLWTGTIATNPGTVYGGKWEALPAGYTLIASGKGKDEFGDFEYAAGQKYGERMHQLTTDELPHIRGDVLDFARQSPNQKLTTHGVFSAPASIESVSFGSNQQSGQGDGFVMDFGKDVPHNNLSPCVAAYVWRRTA